VWGELRGKASPPHVRPSREQTFLRAVKLDPNAHSMLTTGPRRRPWPALLAFQVVTLVDAIERGLDDVGLLTGLDLLLQHFAFRPAGDVDVSGYASRGRRTSGS
jgi:hypothetical protein